MKNLSYNSKKVIEIVIDDELKYRYGKFAKSFSRVVKVSANDLILYALNNDGIRRNCLRK